MKSIYILLLSSFFIGCSTIITPPKKLLSEEQMEGIFYDLALLNASRSVDGSLFNSQQIDISTLIYEKYGVDSLQLAQNISFYSSDPENCKKILSRVNLRLKEEDSLLQLQRMPPSPPAEDLPEEDLP